jgi:murein L,D-transpeptidase YcbB/YkuD
MVGVRTGLVLMMLVSALGAQDAVAAAQPALSATPPQRPRLAQAQVPETRPLLPTSPAPLATPMPSAEPARQTGAAAAPSTTPAQPPSAKPGPPIPEPVKVSSDPRPTLTPETFVVTMRAAERYRQIAESGGWREVPAGANLKLGDRGPSIVALRQRLVATGDLPAEAAAGDLFDTPLVEAVKGFQARHGLPESGLVAARTFAALNVPADIRARQLTASASRLMGSKFAFGDRYVVVNIPSATAEAVQGGAIARRYVAIVGKPDRPSPTVETRITAVNFNPTWTVPVSLIKKDIIPHMRKDPGYLAKLKFHVLDGNGQDVDPAKINWTTEDAVNYTLRQDPGVANSLGEVRIDMPNRHAVYMHDTPSKRLFARNVRFESSGCVRVSGVRDLVAWLLDSTPAAANADTTPTQPPASSWSVTQIDAAITSAKRQDVKLAKPVPVAWVYLTGYATSDGTVHFRDDPYNLDNPADPKPEAPLTIDALVTGSIARRP